MPAPSAPITLFLCGDVMTGRGIDQVLPYPCDPRLHESSVKMATQYVELAEAANGPIPRPVEFSYVWGDALAELDRRAPDVRIINLETSITRSEAAWPKGINYRMSPENVPAITAAKIDVCALANNHLLDWGDAGLLETLDTLKGAGVQPTGAGRDRDAAAAPAVVEVAGKGRVLVFSFGSGSSGIPPEWAATDVRPGVNLLADLSEWTVDMLAARVRVAKRSGDLVVASIHWGSNWGYEIPREQIRFAHQLIDEAGVDLVHGHSSHHPKGIEVYQGKPILYGCGDFLDDYEGITGYEQYRDDLVLMYFLHMDPATGKPVSVQMTPMQIKRFRLHRATREDAEWLCGMLNREGKRFGTGVELKDDLTLTLWFD